MNTMKRNLVLVLVGFLALGFTGVSFGQEKLFEKGGVGTIEGPKWAPGEIIVKFERGVSQDVIRQINQPHGTSVLSISKRGQFKRLRIPRNRTVEEMVAIYSQNPNVEYAEPNFIASALMTPNDPYYSYQWHLDNSYYGGINMEFAWDIQTGDPSVVVAVIDTGVAYEDYQPSRREKYYLAPDLAQTSFKPGYDSVNDDTHPNDDNGHGTHVAGTIAQSTDNTIGVAGVAFNCSIMPVKVLDKRGSGTYADIADGVYFAADKGADVINLSLGGTSPSTTIEDALAYAYEKDVTIVCAAGNEYEEGNPPVYPAAYDDYCIAVGATRYDETRAYYSNTGSYLDLTAPGGDLNVDQNNDGYGDGVLQQTFDRRTNDWGYWFYQGTSMAAPHVAGIAALLIAKGITGPHNVREALENTAEDHGPTGCDEAYGWGIVDAYAALQYEYVGEPVHDVAVTGISAPSWVLPGDTVSVVVTVANQSDHHESFDVTLTDTTDGPLGSQLVSLDAGDSTLVSFNWDTTGASIDDHILEAEAIAVTGETDTADNSRTTTVTVKEPVHDVAVIAIDAPLDANEGDLVSVSVTVENQGTYSETPTVTLTDITGGLPIIGSETISLLNAGDSTTISFDWDTTGASIDDHILEAEASAVQGETDTADNSMTTTVTIKEKSTASMQVTITNHRVKPKWDSKKDTGKAEVNVAFTIDSGSSSQVVLKEITDEIGTWSLEKPQVEVKINGVRYKWPLDLDENGGAIVDFAAHGKTLTAGDKVEVKMKLLNDQSGAHSLTCEILANDNEIATDTVNFSF